MGSQQQFKQTEIGRIPEEWEVVKLEDIITKFISGGTPSTKNPSYWNGEIPWITSTYINGFYVNSGEKYISKAGLENSATNIVPKDNILIATRVGIGKVAVNLIDIAISQDLTGAVVRKDKVYPNFLCWSFLSPKVRNGLQSFVRGTTIKGIARSELVKIQLPLPPLPEQKKIAEILSTVDKAIEKVDEAIEKTQRLKKGLMQELLTKGIGHKEFKDTEIGRIPKEWEVVSLSEVFRLASGKSRPSEISEMQTEKMLYPIYGGNGILGYTNKFMINNETIVIGRVGEYCGSIYKAPKLSWITDNALYAIEIQSHNINLDFLTYWLTFINLNKFKRESGQPLMTQTIVYSIQLPLPPLPEQKKIAEILSTVDKRLDLLRKKKEKLERVKRGLMDDLLSGRRRVTNLISKEV
jgi:type I restriction enzyme S subunit